MFHSEFPDVGIVDLALHDAVLGDAERHGDRPALIDGITGETVSYAQLVHAVGRVAAGLAEAGVRQGDVVALFSPNTIRYPMAFFGATRAARPSPPSPPSPPPANSPDSSPTAARAGC